MRRRSFLKAATAVAAPGVLAACATPPPAPREARPEDDWFEHFELSDTALDEARRALGARGADFGEIFLQSKRTATTVLDAAGKAKTTVRTVRGAGLRSVRGGDEGFAATADLGPAALSAAATSAARGASADIVLPPLESTMPGSRPYSSDRPWSDVPDRLRTGLVAGIAERLRAGDDTVSRVDIQLVDEDEWVLIATLDGRLVADRRPMVRLSVQTEMTRGADTQSGFESIAARDAWTWIDDDRLDALIERSLKNAERRFDARRPPAGDMTVLLAAGTGGVLLHEAIGHAFEADIAAAGRGLFRSADGQEVADIPLTIIDDATLASARGALAVDDEGEAGRRTVIVEDGRLRSLLHDRRRPGPDGSTGNARRESYRHLPLPRMTATFVANGDTEPGEMVAGMERGVIVEGITGGTVDPDSGDFRFSASFGWYVENGVRRVPIRDFELAGNGPELLRNLKAVGNDLRMDPAGWLCGKAGQSVPVSHGAPSLLVGSLRVSPVELQVADP